MSTQKLLWVGARQLQRETTRRASSAGQTSCGISTWQGSTSQEWKGRSCRDRLQPGRTPTTNTLLKEGRTPEAASRTIPQSKRSEDAGHSNSSGRLLAALGPARGEKGSEKSQGVFWGVGNVLKWDGSTTKTPWELFTVCKLHLAGIRNIQWHAPRPWWSPGQLWGAQPAALGRASYSLAFWVEKMTSVH